jgi:tRNA G18 (ribose-2'-O)-methylase SpoU
VAFLPLVGNIGSLNVGHSVTAVLAELRRQGWSHTPPA